MIDQHPVSELRGMFQINCATGLGGGGGGQSLKIYHHQCVLKRGILPTFKVGVHPYLNDSHFKRLKEGIKGRQ